MFGRTDMAAGDPTATPLSDAQLREVVERAFPETTVETVAATAESPDAYRSDDVERAWQAMHEVAHGGEVALLLELLDGTWLRGEDRWKAVTFLGLSLRTGLGAGMQDAALRALTAEATVTHRDTAPPDTVRVQGAALDAIAGSLATLEAKWRCMLTALEPSRSQFGEIVRKLGNFRPAGQETAAAALPMLLDAMVRTKSVLDLHHITHLIKEMDCRSEASQLRRLLLAANADMSANIAWVLAAWDDKEAIGEIRRAIDQYHLVSDANVDVLVAALHSLDGDECADYVAEVFRTAPAALREYLLGNALTKIRHPSVVRAVREVAETTSDVELKIAADAYLVNAPATPMAAPPTAASPRDGPSANVETPPVEAEDAGWVPKYEEPPNAPRVSPSVPAVPATPTDPTLERPVRPDGGAESPWRTYSEPLTLELDDPAPPRSYGGLIAVLLGIVVVLAVIVFLRGG